MGAVESSAAMAAAPAAVADAAEPGKVLVIAVTVQAPLAEVWKAFSTREGLSTWLGPDTTVDLKPGGDWLVHFPGGSTGGGTIVSFAPEKEIVIAALAPDKFPTVRAQRTQARFEFEAHGSATVVRLTQTGWKQGAEWDNAYEYLTAGNAQLMTMLVHRFVHGPMDWSRQ